MQSNKEELMPTVMITGANRGLGLEFIRHYANNGWNVIGTCRDPDKAKDVQAAATGHPKLRIVALDITNAESRKTLAKQLKDAAIDVLINNAGILSGNAASAWEDDNAPDQIFGSLDADAWAKVLLTNTLAPVMVSEAFLGHIKNGAQRKIIMISSLAGSITGMSRIGHIAYRSSKTALNTAMHNMSLGLEKDGIIVVSLHPGWVQTDMGGKGADITPAQSIEGMTEVIAGLSLSDSGKFLDYKGAEVPW
jgi:NAD(P)-dependent dehydrogenase (short-subunit alcohol dehydrogenase family)